MTYNLVHNTHNIDKISIIAQLYYEPNSLVNSVAGASMAQKNPESSSDALDHDVSFPTNVLPPVSFHPAEGASCPHVIASGAKQSPVIPVKAYPRESWDGNPGRAYCHAPYKIASSHRSSQ